MPLPNKQTSMRRTSSMRTLLQVRGGSGGDAVANESPSLLETLSMRQHEVMLVLSIRLIALALVILNVAGIAAYAATASQSACDATCSWSLSAIRNILGDAIKAWLFELPGRSLDLILYCGLAGVCLVSLLSFLCRNEFGLSCCTSAGCTTWSTEACWAQVDVLVWFVVAGLYCVDACIDETSSSELNMNIEPALVDLFAFRSSAFRIAFTLEFLGGQLAWLAATIVLPHAGDPCRQVTPFGICVALFCLSLTLVCPMQLKRGMVDWWPEPFYLLGYASRPLILFIWFLLSACSADHCVLCATCTGRHDENITKGCGATPGAPRRRLLLCCLLNKKRIMLGMGLPCGYPFTPLGSSVSVLRGLLSVLVAELLRPRPRLRCQAAAEFAQAWNPENEARAFFDIGRALRLVDFSNEAYSPLIQGSSATASHWRTFERWVVDDATDTHCLIVEERGALASDRKLRGERFLGDDNRTVVPEEPTQIVLSVECSAISGLPRDSRPPYTVRIAAGEQSVQIGSRTRDMRFTENSCIVLPWSESNLEQHLTLELQDEGSCRIGDVVKIPIRRRNVVRGADMTIAGPFQFSDNVMMQGRIDVKFQKQLALVIAFRGTVSWQNVSTDLQFRNPGMLGRRGRAQDLEEGTTFDSLAVGGQRGRSSNRPSPPLVAHRISQSDPAHRSRFHFTLPRLSFGSFNQARRVEELLSDLSNTADREHGSAFDLVDLSRCLDAQLRLEGYAEGVGAFAGRHRIESQHRSWRSRCVDILCALPLLPLRCLGLRLPRREEDASLVDPLTLQDGGLTRVRVHRGFLAAYLSIRTELLSVVRARLAAAHSDGRMVSVYATGHSLGGALATLAMLDLRIALGDEMRNQHSRIPFEAGGSVSSTGSYSSSAFGLYTFGSPRPGNSEFRTLFNILAPREAFRIVARRDLVTALPPGLRQVGREVWLDSAGEPVFCMSWSMKNLLPRRLGLRDHRLTEYYALLASKFQRDHGWRFVSSWMDDATRRG